MKKIVRLMLLTFLLLFIIKIIIIKNNKRVKKVELNLFNIQVNI